MDAGAHAQVLSERYELVEPLGRGATAQVWRARDRVLARDVAVKVFDDRVVLDSDTRRAQEMHLLAGLAHPGLVTVFDAGVEDDTTFLVMEFVDGPTLSQLLDRGPLDPALTATIGAQLAETLAYVHGERVVHRDVKPANVLLSERDGETQAKLADFGVARLLDRTRVTAHGSTVGTANYLSPEQALGNEVNPPSDVYALGLVLIECLTGVPAYPGHGVEAAVARLLRAPRLPEGLAADWHQLLSTMTAYTPEDRPTAVDAMRTLRSITESTPDASDVIAAMPVPTAVGGTTVLPAVESRRRFRRSAIAIGALAAAAAGVVLAWTLTTTGAVPAEGTPTTPSSSRGVAEPSPARARPSTSTSSSAAAVPSASSAVPAAKTQPAQNKTKAARKKHQKRQHAPAGPAGPKKPAPPGEGPGRHKP